MSVAMPTAPSAVPLADTALHIRGVRRAFGPRDKVLEQMVQNSAQIRQAQTSGQGGGVA